MADPAWSIGEGHFRFRGCGWQDSLERAWLAENFPEYFYFYTSMILINNFNNEGSVDVDVDVDLDVECPYITEDSYYIASSN